MGFVNIPLLYQKIWMRPISLDFEGTSAPHQKIIYHQGKCLSPSYKIYDIISDL